eukprot:TRINITY_DN5834_c0_g2_i1.p1 TRINITY_DN5834_c0_g2~~TRINITY_DN5834_c0_g2_i1.p1  ORF type:complete len:815 (+),score=191.17 TRINITY_DN5834_c0_g2_i1:116-2560(+)
MGQTCGTDAQDLLGVGAQAVSTAGGRGYFCADACLPDGRPADAPLPAAPALTSPRFLRSPSLRGRGQGREGDGSFPETPASAMRTFRVLRTRRVVEPEAAKAKEATIVQSQQHLQLPESYRRSAVAASKHSKESWRRWYRPTRELGRGISAAVYEAETIAPVELLAAGAGYQSSSSSSAASPRVRFAVGEDGFAHKLSGCPGAAQQLLVRDAAGFMRQPAAICGRQACSTASHAAASLLPSAAFPCLPGSQPRRVALKRFKKVKSRSFHNEVAALLKIGAHPHVLRLLESYEDCEGEDVLVLEYCDGGSLFDTYAQAHQRRDKLPELLVARLLRQLLTALEHIHACGVEHQDIKPENMLLHNFSLQEQRAELKLADFGWAVPMPEGERRSAESLPTDGAGSLWYAPPELNPAPPGSSRPTYGIRGRADVWSVGIVAYLLLIGHNPFHMATLQASNAKETEGEVLTLVSRGIYDTSCHGWQRLAQDARAFIAGMLRVAPESRISITEALKHPYLARKLARCPEMLPVEPVWRWSDRDNMWSQFDGLQQLAWLAVARAVSESELHKESVNSAFRAMQAYASNSRRAGARPADNADVAYAWQLARELSSTPVGTWLQQRGAWAEVARTAFSYLDIDGDGMLSPQDIVVHIAAAPLPGDAMSGSSSDSWAAAHFWVRRWGQDCKEADGVASSLPGSGSSSADKYHSAAGLSMQGFLRLLTAGAAVLKAEDMIAEESSVGPLAGASTGAVGLAGVGSVSYDGDLKSFDEDEEAFAEFNPRKLCSRRCNADIRRRGGGGGDEDTGDFEEELLCWPEVAAR